MTVQLEAPFLPVTPEQGPGTMSIDQAVYNLERASDHPHKVHIEFRHDEYTVRVVIQGHRWERKAPFLALALSCLWRDIYGPPKPVDPGELGQP